MELKKLNLDTQGPTIDPVKKSPVNISQPMEEKPLFTPLKIAGLVIVLALGLGSGYFLKNWSGSPVARNNGSVIARNVPESGLKEGDIIGVQDDKQFKDSATGVLQKGGLDGEGSHRLLRPGGPSQTVYLTSSVIDLDAFEGSQVTVWGETFKGQKVGWLMDVGRVRVEKLNAPTPE